MRHKGLNPVT